jgi:hypothetical protein
VQNRSLDSDTTTLTLRINEEFYDDGSDQLVPTKHPDLSTQPSILPYKFMGQYVYEQLIPVSLTSNPNPAIPKTFLLDILAVDKPIFLEAFAIGEQVCLPAKVEIKSLEIEFSNLSLEEIKIIKYYKVIYTSMPEEDSYYYGYNNYGGGNIEDFSNAAVIRLEGDYTSVQNVYFLSEDIERINDNTYVYRNLSGAPSTTGTSISITNNTGEILRPKSAKIYLDGVELDSTKVTVQSYGPIDITTPLEINKYNTIEAIINL